MKVYKVTNSKGIDYYTSSAVDVSNWIKKNPLDGWETMEMTEEGYNAIPATEEATRAFEE